jgi:hypothetical protein
MGEAGMIRGGLAALGVVMLAGCATDTPTYRELETMGGEYERGGTSMLAAPTNMEEATRRDSCGSRPYRDRIGHNVNEAEVPSGSRLIGPDTVVTDDFRPSRLNIITDANGVITALQCY